MNTRTSDRIVSFKLPFSLKAVDRLLALGDCRVLTDEALMDGLSFPVYRRISTMIFLPAQFHQASSVELVTIDPLDLQEAQERDIAHASLDLPTEDLAHPGERVSAATRSTATRAERMQLAG